MPPRPTFVRGRHQPQFAQILAPPAPQRKQIPLLLFVVVASDFESAAFRPAERKLTCNWASAPAHCAPNCHSKRSDAVFSCARFVCAGSHREESLRRPASALAFLELFLRLKIKMMMLAAPRIEPRPASWTPRLAIQILPNRHLHPATAAQNCPLAPFHTRPNRDRMPRQRNVTILASPVDPATPHLDRNDIQRRPVMHAPRLRIKLDPAHLWMLLRENGELRSNPRLGLGSRSNA